MIRPFCDCMDFVEADKKLHDGKKRTKLWHTPAIAHCAMLLGIALYAAGLRPLAFVPFAFAFLLCAMAGYSSLMVSVHVVLYRHRGEKSRVKITIMLFGMGISTTLAACLMGCVALYVPWSFTLEPLYSLFALTKYMQ